MASSSGVGRAALLVLAGVAWVIVAHPFEGPRLVTLSGGHGLHLNDWVALLAVWQAWLAVRPEPRTRPALLPVRVARGRRSR